MAFDKFASPTIPSPPKNYDPVYFIQFIRTVQNFFTIIGSNAAVNAAIMTPTMLRTPQTALALTNGNNDNVLLPPSTFFRIEGPTALFAVRGINSSPQAANDGRQIILYNPTIYNMQIHNEEAAVTAENRILTGTGTNINLSGTGTAYLIYSIKDLRWIVIAHSG